MKELLMLAKLVRSDPEGEDLTFKLTGSNDIEISETGYLKFITAPDFETKSEYTATIIATDPAGNATELDTVLTIRDVNEAPVFTSDSAFTFDENATSAITTITTTDEDTDSAVTYQITGGTDGARFSVNSTGELRFSGFIPDFENPLYSNDNDYEVTVTAYDGVNEASQAITVTVNNLNDERPIITSPTQFVFEVPENFPLQTKIPGIDITGYDPDGNKLRACQQSNPDGLTPNTGLMVASQLPMSATQTCDLLFGSQANTDYESGPKSFKIEVAILDKNNPVTGRTGNNNVSDTQLITVNITDVNDNPPVFADVNYDITIVENTKGPTLLETTDADTGSTVTYSLSGADADDFEIVNNTLALKEAADFETKTSYAVTVTARRWC